MEKILSLLATNPNQALDLIDDLSHAERILVRTQCEQQGLPLPRNLYYDYSTQEWI